MAPSKTLDKDSLVLQVAVPSPLRRIFDYLPPVQLKDCPPDYWQTGLRLRIPFGKRQVVGFLVGVSDTSELERGRLKRALAVLDAQPVFSPALQKTLAWAATYYQHTAGEVYATALPVKLRQGASTEPPATRVWTATDTARDALESLDRAPRQRALLTLLLEKGPLTGPECSDAGYTPDLLRRLQERGLVTEIERTESQPAPSQSGVLRSKTFSPNTEQAAAIATIVASLDGFSCHLLDGVTGSGKTEVYLQSIAQVLQRGRQALVLVPEIGLTPQTIEQFAARFDCDIVALHSGMTDRERLAGWYQARTGAAGIVIGTRSAVFTPLARPGLVVVDEEHDGSFKQQDGLRYSARDLAIVRAREENVPVVLGTATPALETLHNAQAGRYSHLLLRERAGNAARPPIGLLDISSAEVTEGFAATLLDTMQHHLEAGNQVLVFINRRGFAPALHCQDCGHVFECQRCDAQFTVHRAPPGLQCHHCETRRELPRSCDNCGSKRLQTRGMGTEKTELFLQQRFEAFPVIRIDRDSTRRRNALNERLGQVRSGAPCLLVGTQMLAKGHHFPGVTLVTVLDADSGLFSPDFRGQEHMIQLLFQVAGRAGRAESPGQVVVQTRHGGHPLLEALVHNDYQHIAKLLLEERRAAGMPPFGHLALIRAESTAMQAALDLLQAVFEHCAAIHARQPRDTLKVHHPLPAPMEKRSGRFRAQLLLRADARGELQALLSEITPLLESLPAGRRVRWSIDVDPQDLT